MAKKHVKKSKRHTKKRKGGENTRDNTTDNRMEIYTDPYKNQRQMQIIYPTNINQDTYIENIKNYDYDSYNEYIFNVDKQIQMKNNPLLDQTDSQSTIISTQTEILNILIKYKNKTKYINLFFYINQQLFFSVRKLLYNDGILASLTNVLFYKILNNAISWKDNTLLISHNAYTENTEVNVDPFYRPTKPSIFLKNDMFEPVTSGPEYIMIRDWRASIKANMHNKELAFKAVTNVLCSIS